MRSSEKPLLGLWLYRSEEDWSYKEDVPMAIKDEKESKLISIIFTLKNQIGALVRALQSFQDLGINILHIESRPSMSDDSQIDYLVDIECDQERVESLWRLLKKEVLSMVIGNYGSAEKGFPPLESAGTNLDLDEVQWFPKKISDLDFAQNILIYGRDLDGDHPSFTDPIYRKRREHISKIANGYKHGQPIPRVQYTEEETKTWGTVFREMHKLYPKYACKEHLEHLPQLAEHCGFREDNIPQLQDISDFLKTKTGFQLRPVGGYLHPRDFLAGLAFRLFHSVQYIRHPSDPYYTPEPDCCHELLGHIPLLVNPRFAQFSQELGLASLGASDEDVENLSNLYLFTVEFGLCKQDGELRVFGAALLSSVAELKHAIGNPEKIKRLYPEVACKEECLITAFQKVYYCTDTFEEAIEMVRAFAQKIQRPFGIRYNPYTYSVEVVRNDLKITALVSELRGDLCIVNNALKKISSRGSTLDIEGIARVLQSGFTNGDVPQPNPIKA